MSPLVVEGSTDPTPWHTGHLSAWGCVVTDGSGWEYETHIVTFNSSVFEHAKGHYNITILANSSNAYVGDDSDFYTYGKHSFYNNSGAWSAFGTANHMVDLYINTSRVKSIELAIIG